MSVVWAILLTSMFLAVSAASGQAQDLMVMDKRTLQIGFQVEVMGLFGVTGRFRNATGIMSYNKKHPATSVVRIVIDTASIDTGGGMRDSYLRSSSLFDVNNHPKMVFQSTRAVVVNELTANVVGDLTLKGITKPLSLIVKARPNQPVARPSQNAAFSARFEASGRVRREQYGLGSGYVLLTIRADFVRCDDAAISIDGCGAHR